MKQNKGITLMALVVTIVVMIILAGVSINLLMGENGIITKSKNAKKEQEIAEIYERLELQKGPVAIEESGKLQLSKYIEYLEKEGITSHEITYIEKENEENTYITVDDKYVFLAEQEESGNIKITYEGEAKNLPPKIVSISATNTTNSITVKVSGKRVDKYEYYLKEDGTYKKKHEEETSGEGMYPFEGLAEGIVYEIKIVAINENGEVAEEITKKTGNMEDLTEANTTFDYEPDKWTKGSVVATASTTVTGYTLQTSKDGITWTNDLSQTYTENGTVYARIWDGTNESSITGNVTNIDKEAPTGSIDLTSTTNSITVTVNANDREATPTNGCSGIKGYYYSKDNGSTYTEMQTSNIYPFTDLDQSTTYNIKVKVEDKAGNELELSGSTGTGSVGDLTQANTTFDYNPDEWTNGSVVATVSTTVQGFTLQTSKDGIKWENTASQTYTENGTVYARLVDTKGQEGGSTTGNVTNIDKTPPTATIKLGTEKQVTNEPIKATVTQSDANSGIDTNNCKWVFNKTSTPIKTDDPSKYSDGTFGSATQEISISASTAGTYYLHVLTTDVAGNSIETISKPVTIEIAPVASATLKAGDYVSYEPTSQTFTMTTEETGYASNQTYSTSAYTGLWRVLYNDATNGLQIVSDTEVDRLYLTNSRGYHSAVGILNTFCKKYENPSLTVEGRGRSIGTNPTNPGEDTRQNQTLSFKWNDSYDSGLKMADTRYLTDYEAMKKATSQGTSGIHNIGTYYWMPSRNVYADSELAYFSLYTVTSEGTIEYRRMTDMYANGNIYKYDNYYGVRPVVTLKTTAEVVSGNGTSSNPYRLR